VVIHEINVDVHLKNFVPLVTHARVSRLHHDGVSIRAIASCVVDVIHEGETTMASENVGFHPVTHSSVRNVT